MTSKEFFIPEVGKVLVTKRRSSRHLRLMVNNRGETKISIPRWQSYQTAVNFARQKSLWIAKQQTKHNAPVLKDGAVLGIKHSVQLVETLKRPILKTPKVLIPASASLQDKQVIKVLQDALRYECRQFLEPEFVELARQHRFKYRHLRFRAMTSRWGSCSSQGNINISIYVAQLPNYLVNYVMLHELVHTVEHNHSANFWRLLEKHYPNYASAKKELKSYRPNLMLT